MVTRTAGTTAHVTVDIGTLPSLPRNHYGYALVKSDSLPLVIVRGPNTAPVFSDGRSTTRSVAEDTARGVNIGDSVFATDADGDTLTYSFSGIDASIFSINSSTGQLQTREVLDYETKASYSVTVVVSDSYGGSDSITVRIHVTDIQENRAPVFTEGNRTTRAIAENTASGQHIGSVVSATDADNDTLTYSLSGINAASFSIDSTSGQLQAKAALDYETKTSYTVTVTVSDGNGGSGRITVTINVTDIDENGAPVFSEGSTTTRAVAENTAAGSNIGDAVSATDQDAKDTLTYTLKGTDAASFHIDSKTGQLKTKAALDYEAKNTYSVTLTVSDGLAADTIAVTINVTDIDENRAPMFTDGKSTTRTVAENTAAGTNIGDAVSATDQDAKDTLTYTLGGTDAAAFSIDSKSGQLKTKAALNYETKNTYSVLMTVSDGLATDTIAVTINITDIDENRAPVFTEGTSTTRSIAENTAAGSNIGDTISATDPDGDTLTYSLEGQDASTFSIDTNTGQLKTSASLNYELKSVYTVSVTASDGKRTATITVTINITDMDESSVQGTGGQGQGASTNNAPVFTEGSTTTRSVPEDTVSGMGIGNAVSATDADGDTLTYSLGGADANSFRIDSTTGQLRAYATLDYETPSSYAVTITVSDGSLTDTITVSINVTESDQTVDENVGESTNNAPVFTDGTSTTRYVAENTASGTNIGSPISATDANNDSLTYSLSGTDAATFRIDSTTGQLRTYAALDYETKSSYTVTVSVFDENGGNGSIVVTISITDINERTDPLYGRTQQVQNAIVAAVPGVNSAVNVTAAHLAAITYLGLYNKNIASLKTSDFNGLTSLTALDLSFNSISNISPLENLTTLTGLDLSANSISDISPLEDLTNLKILRLWNNSISDISVLENLTNLTGLSLSYNSISDVSALKDLTNLTVLGLYGNSIEDISPLKKLTALTRLGLTGNSVSDISTLEGLTDLTWLDLHSNSISDLSPLEDLTNLTYLRLTGNSVSDISALEDLTALTELMIWHNSIEDISPLEELTSLTKLSLSWNSISDISPLENLTNLTWLAIGKNSISNVSALENLTSLKTLALFENPISDYAPLRRLKTAIGVIDDHPGLSLDITIPTVANTNVPVFTDGASTTRSIAENTASDTNIGSAVAATDADTGDTLSYYLGGTDAASFSIVSTSGQLQTSAALDYETKTSYSVKVAVSDGKGGNDTIDVTINVTDVENAAPTVQTSHVIPDNTALFTNFPNPFKPGDVDPVSARKTCGCYIDDLRHAWCCGADDCVGTSSSGCIYQPFSCYPLGWSEYVWREGCYRSLFLYAHNWRFFRYAQDVDTEVAKIGRKKGRMEGRKKVGRMEDCV